jgi:hypothetical protein
MCAEAKLSPTNTRGRLFSDLWRGQSCTDECTNQSCRPRHSFHCLIIPSGRKLVDDMTCLATGIGCSSRARANRRVDENSTLPWAKHLPGGCQERPAAGRRALCKSHRELLQRAAGSYTLPYRPARAPCHCFPFFRDDRGLSAAVSTCAALRETRADIDQPFPRADSHHPFSRADRPCVPHSTCWPLRLASQGPHTQPSPTLQACVAKAPGWMIRRENEASGLR